MFTNKQKTEILALIDYEKQRLGSYSAVARKCRVSEASISQLRNGSYLASGDEIYHTIAIALNYNPKIENWILCEEIGNYRIMTDILQKTKDNHLFMGIAEMAGSGKTTAATQFVKNNMKDGCFMIECRNWSPKKFLSKIAREIDAKTISNYPTTDDLLDAIVDAVKRMSHLNPLLIIDQANSLKPSSMQYINFLQNETKDILGLAIIGTKNLELEIKRGVRFGKQGYDELDSRFGRVYLDLQGITLTDFRKLCILNGIDDADKQKHLFECCKPVRKEINGKAYRAVEDIRHIRRVITLHKFDKYES